MRIREFEVRLRRRPPPQTQTFSSEHISTVIRQHIGARALPLQDFTRRQAPFTDRAMDLEPPESKKYPRRRGLTFCAGVA
jgi:hypothetical protein